jgi:hypothetical protein
MALFLAVWPARGVSCRAQNLTNPLSPSSTVCSVHPHVLGSFLTSIPATNAGLITPGSPVSQSFSAGLGRSRDFGALAGAPNYSDLTVAPVEKLTTDPSVGLAAGAERVSSLYLRNGTSLEATKRGGRSRATSSGVRIAHVGGKLRASDDASVSGAASTTRSHASRTTGVPESATGWLLGLGLPGLIWMQGRKGRRMS